MNKPVRQQAAKSFVSVNEARNGNDGQKKKCVVRSLHSEVHVDVGKADKKRMGNSISCHR